MRRLGLWILLAAAGAGCTRDGAGSAAEPKELVVFHAGSLAVPFRDLSGIYSRRHPGVKVLAEAAGSRDCARKISELGRRCDVFGSADHAVIRNLLIPEHATFEIRFATNEMSIAYTGGSREADRITADNWHQVLLREDVAFGRSDPDSDPCGYRTVMVFQLAERMLGEKGLARRLRAKHGKKYIRPKETDLLALLESGELDYIFIYRSVATQHGLEILRLPDRINLRSPDLAGLYAHARVEVSGRAPGRTITRRGAPIVYAVTIPRAAPHPEGALAYLELLLSEQGRALMERNGQPALQPARCFPRDEVPARLRGLCQGGASP